MKTLKETRYCETTKFKAVEELMEKDFIARGLNPDYFNENLLGDITAYLLSNGEIAEAEGGGQIVGRWDKEVYKAITWE